MKESSQPIDSMASKRKCFYSGCATSPSWGVESAAAPKNQDGSPWYLLACDEHEEALTTDMRRAGTKYALFPVIGPPDVPKECQHRIELFDEDTYESELKKLPPFTRVVINGVTFLIAVIITFPVLLFYGVGWILGWRPAEDDVQ